MNAFIIICVAFVALVSVNCDEKSDVKAMIAKLTAMYANMSDADIKPKVVANVKAIEGIMEAAIKKYVTDDLNLVAVIDLNVIKFLNEGMPKLFADMDKLTDAKLKHSDYVQLGVIAEVIKGLAQKEDKTRAANPIKVIDTAENLMKTYNEEYKKMLDLLKWTVDMEKKKSELTLWANVHEKIYEYMAPGLKQIDDALKNMTKATQAKNLQVMLADLRLMVKAVDTREKTFSSKFTEKVHEIYSEVKQFFAKIF